MLFGNVSDPDVCYAIRLFNIEKISFLCFITTWQPITQRLCNINAEFQEPITQRLCNSYCNHEKPMTQRMCDKQNLFQKPIV